jgi:phenylpropionate dioxygenase-like ring-hydroxylating dioxygenase large terminal subunit
MVDLDDLVDAERGLLNPEIYFNDEIYQRELEHVFGRAWQFLAHDSMIPKTGDFFQTYMGEDPVLIVRQRDGSVKAFLNQCRHRGMRLCRADKGNLKAFTCTYHGWTYDIAGRLINVPHEEDGYHNELDKDAWGPIQVTKLENYKGFWFGTWDESAPSLTEYLGDFAWWFDAHIDRYEGGVEDAIGVYKWVMNCNWKFAAEQFASDAYHAEISHASAVIVLAEQQGRTVETTINQRFQGGRQISSPYGHGSGMSMVPLWQTTNSPAIGEWMQSTYPSVRERLGEPRATWARGHATIFPNFSFLSNGTMRVWLPRGPNEVETWAWAFVPVAAPPEIKRAMALSTQRTFSASGLFEQDDGENWNEIQKVLRGYQARHNKFNAQMGLGHAGPDPEGLVPGRVLDWRIGEEPARGFYRRWNDMLKGLSWAELDERAKQWAVADAESALVKQ